MPPPDYLLGPTGELTSRSFLLAQTASNPQKNQKKGTFILVRSSAAGAHVLLDDVRVGEVNRLIRVAPGIRKVTVVHSEYQSKTFEVRLIRGKRQVIRIQLSKKDSMTPTSPSAPPAVAAAPTPPVAGYSMQPGYPLPGQAPPAQPYVVPPVTVVQPPAGYYGATQPGVSPAPPPRKRRKKRRKRRKPEAKEFAPSIAQAPPVKPRGGGDYVLSLLPLGIPQMRHKKPALGILFLLVQGGGIGTYFAWDPLIVNPMIEKRDSDLKSLNDQYTAQTHKDPNGPKKIKDHADSTKQEIETWQQWKPAPLIAAGVFYGISVLEAMFVGPPVPKSPLEKMLGSQNSTMGLALDHSPDPLFRKMIHNSDWNLGVVPASSSVHLVLDWTLAL